MTRRRLTSNDRYFGPLTWARSSWNPIRLVFSTGGDGDDDTPFNSLTAYAFGWVARLGLPTLMQPHRIKHKAAYWDAATVARMGRDWYYETFAKDYGFCIHEGHLVFYLGPQTHDSTTTKSWSTFLPWTQWRFFRHVFYDLSGAECWRQEPTSGRRNSERWDALQMAKDACPSASFLIEDYDGKPITATTIIEQREWKFGEGWFKWLSLFRKNRVRRSLDISFSSETGPEKGSWKGGTCGTSIDMLPGELHEAAFKRYCENEHRSKSGKYRVKFIGIAPSTKEQSA